MAYTWAWKVTTELALLSVSNRSHWTISRSDAPLPSICQKTSLSLSEYRSTQNGAMANGSSAALGSNGALEPGMSGPFTAVSLKKNHPLLATEILFPPTVLPNRVVSNLLPRSTSLAVVSRLEP